MKKLFAIIATLVVSTFAFNAKAQLSNIEGMPPYKLGITVGMNNSGLTGEDRLDPILVPTELGFDKWSFPSEKYTNVWGFQIGANLMVDASPLIQNTFARVEAKYSRKGAKWSFEDKSVAVTEDVSLHYLEIPVHYGYAWFINDNISLMAETGPYFSFGFSGVSKVASRESKQPNVGVFDRGNRFDCGWGAQASVMIAKNYQLHVAYDYGFININKTYLQNRNLSFGFTWFFESLFE